MKILVDYHHPQLLKSLKMLFEGRLGAEVYVPRGREWWDEGYYNYYDNEGQSLEFLKHEGVTLEAAKEMKFDFIVSTIPLTEGCFLKFLYECQPQAKHIVVLGNVGYMPRCANLMTSTSWNGYLDQHMVRFNQEFDTEMFHGPTYPDKLITSFMHHHPAHKDYLFFLELKKLMSDWKFKSYGFNCIDGVLDEQHVASEMRESSFIWHVKDVGEGYGHVIHTAAYMGVPMIFRGSFMRGCLSSKYLMNGDTGIDLDLYGSPESAMEAIKHYSDPTQLARMGLNLQRIFSENVDFEKEAQDVAKFLEQCK